MADALEGGGDVVKHGCDSSSGARSIGSEDALAALLIVIVSGQGLTHPV
jgi:hypothetical protein